VNPMGRAGALGIGQSIVPAEALVGDVVTKVIWPRMGEAAPASPATSAPSQAAFVAPRAAPRPTPPDTTATLETAADDAASAAAEPDVDGAQIVTALRSERVAANSGFGHPHAAAGCGFCRRAASAYR
jgi:hypothetical protein